MFFILSYWPCTHTNEHTQIYSHVDFSNFCFLTKEERLRRGGIVSCVLAFGFSAVTWTKPYRLPHLIIIIRSNYNFLSFVLLAWLSSLRLPSAYCILGRHQLFFTVDDRRNFAFDKYKRLGRFLYSQFDRHHR